MNDTHGKVSEKGFWKRKLVRNLINTSWTTHGLTHGRSVFGKEDTYFLARGYLVERREGKGEGYPEKEVPTSLGTSPLIYR